MTSPPPIASARTATATLRVPVPALDLMTFLFSPRLTDHVERDRDPLRGGLPDPFVLARGLMALASAFD